MGCGASQQSRQSSAAVVPEPAPHHQAQDEAAAPAAPVKTQAASGVAPNQQSEAATPVKTQAPSAVEGVQNFDPFKAAVERNAQYVSEHKLLMASRTR